MPTGLRALFNETSFLVTASGNRTLDTYAVGQSIFRQGESADAVYFVKSGSVEVTVASAQGEVIVIAVVRANEFVGEACLTGQRTRLSTATASTECEALRLEKSDLLQAIREQPEFARIFVSHMLTKQARVEADLVNKLFGSTEKQLARILLLLANFGKDVEPQAIIPEINLQTLAEGIGFTRSRVEHFMKKFRQLGFIDDQDHGHLAVHRSLLSVVIHDRPLFMTQPVGHPEEGEK